MVKSRNGYELKINMGISVDGKDYYITREYSDYIVCAEWKDDGEIDITNKIIVTKEKAANEIDYDPGC